GGQRSSPGLSRVPPRASAPSVDPREGSALAVRAIVRGGLTALLERGLRRRPRLLAGTVGPAVVPRVLHGRATVDQQPGRVRRGLEVLVQKLDARGWSDDAIAPHVLVVWSDPPAASRTQSE